MNRPQMIGPDKKIINIFSQDFERYLEQGYSIEELLNTTSKSMPILITSPYIPYTGYPDIDLLTLNHLPFEDIKNQCKINKYTKSLCQQDYFWKQKIINENLYIPTPLNVDHNWMKIYQAALETKTTIWILNHDEGIDINNYSIKQLNIILDKSNINIPDDLLDSKEKIMNLSVYFYDNNFYQLEFQITPDYNRREIVINQEQCYKLIFYTVYYYIND